MHANPQLRNNLRGRSTSANLDELRANGRSSIRVLKPEAIETLIEEGVERASRERGFVPVDKVDDLVAKGRSELRVLLTAREAELAATRAQLEAVTALVQEQQVEIERLRSESGAPAGPAPDSAMMMRLLREVSSLKQTMERTPQVAPQPAPAEGMDSALADKLDGIANSLGAKLDRLRGRSGQGGGGSVVDEPELNLESLFAKNLDVELETNMEDVGVRNKDGKGIGSNLEKIRKLRGGK